MRFPTTGSYGMERQSWYRTPSASAEGNGGPASRFAVSRGLYRGIQTITEQLLPCDSANSQYPNTKLGMVANTYGASAGKVEAGSLQLPGQPILLN